jgi:hypothetical protein
MGLAAGQGQYSGGQHGLDLFDHRRLPNFADFGPFGGPDAVNGFALSRFSPKQSSIAMG